MLKIGEGKAHIVFQKNPGYVRKLPKPGEELSYEDAKKAIAYFQEKFGEICPPTRLKEGQNQSYSVVQKKINGKTLKECSEEISEETLEQLLEFIQKAEEILKNNQNFDYIGFQGNILKRKRDTNKYKDTLYKLLFLIKVFFHFKNIFASSNLMVDEHRKLYYTDNVGELRDDVSPVSPMKIIKILLMKKYKYDIILMRIRKRSQKNK